MLVPRRDHPRKDAKQEKEATSIVGEVCMCPPTVLSKEVANDSGLPIVSELVEFASDPAFAIDDRHPVAAWNRGAEQLFGYAPDEVVGRTVTAPIIFTGGVAMIPGMAAALESVLGQPVIVAPNPQLTGALGAAILAGRQ